MVHADPFSRYVPLDEPNKHPKVLLRQEMLFRVAMNDRLALARGLTYVASFQRPSPSFGIEVNPACQTSNSGGLSNFEDLLTSNRLRLLSRAEVSGGWISYLKDPMG